MALQVIEDLTVNVSQKYLTVVTFNDTSSNRRFDSKCVPKNTWLLLHLMTLQIIEDFTVNVSQKMTWNDMTPN